MKVIHSNINYLHNYIILARFHEFYGFPLNEEYVLQLFDGDMLKYTEYRCFCVTDTFYMHIKRVFYCMQYSILKWPLNLNSYLNSYSTSI